MAQATALATMHPSSSWRRLPAIARFAAALEAFVGIGALAGGGPMIVAPDGHLLGLPAKMLAGTPFDSFLTPGILLFTLVGVVPITAAILTLRHVTFAPLAALAVGLLVVGWICGEMVILGGLQTLAWALYLVIGTVIAAVAVFWFRSSLNVK